MSDSTPSNAWTWKLQTPKSSQPVESAIMPLGDSAESVGATDSRLLVDLGDIKDGGKYRCKCPKNPPFLFTSPYLCDANTSCKAIVKIQSCFRSGGGKETWMMGSGWLVNAKTLITAGHVVYDHQYGLGPATEIRCYIGYNGRDSVGDPSSGVQFSHGRSVVTTAEWVKDVTRQRDLGIVRLDTSFTGNLRILGFSTTPAVESIGLFLGVVGYPGDQQLESGAKITEKGAQMYENFAKIKWDLSKSAERMLEYSPEDISTAGGQSGAPVILRGKTMTVVGTHCYGVDAKSRNNAGNAVNDQYGNEYQWYLDLLDGEPSILAEKNGMNLVRLGPSSAGSKAGANGVAEGIFDSFGDVLKTIGKVGSAVLPMVGAFTGPIGGVLGTVAGSLLGMASETAVMARTEGGLVGDGKNLAIPEGVLERAVVAEAALQTVLQLDLASPKAKYVIQDMHKRWQAGAPNVEVLSKAMAPVMTECGLDVALTMIHRFDAKSGSTEASLSPGRRQPLKGISAVEAGGNDFVELLLGPTVPLSGEEGLFDTLGGWLSKGLTIAKPIATDLARKALAVVAQHVDSKLSGRGSAESAVETLVKPTPNSEMASRQVFQRAVMADVALQTLMDMDKDTLRSLPLHNGTAEEGVMDFFKKTVQMIRPYVGPAAKLAVEKVAPLVFQALAPKTEGAKDTASGTNGANGPNGTGKHARSFSSVIDDAIGGSWVSATPPQFRLVSPVSDVKRGSINTATSAATELALTDDEKALLESLGTSKDVGENPDRPPIMSQPPSPIPESRRR